MYLVNIVSEYQVSNTSTSTKYKYKKIKCVQVELDQLGVLLMSFDFGKNRN